ncbi:MAG: CidA/LrgA family protein [Gammaproteobacteria bacterium]
MLWGLTLVFACQLAGEVLVRLLGLPVPGPVLGMVILLAGVVAGGVPTGLREVASGLLRYLPLFFVPAGVGLITHGDRLRSDWLPLGLGILVSTLATLALVAWLLQRLAPEDD